MTLAALQEALPRDALLRACELTGSEYTPIASGENEARVIASELVREGYLLHYETPRLYKTDDEDLALLAGDRMYAAGLDRLARQGDVPAVGVLARLIARCGEAHAANPLEQAVKACDNLWQEALSELGLHAILARDL